MNTNDAMVREQEQWHQTALQYGSIPTKEQKYQMIEQARAGDPKAREDLILSFLRYAGFLAQKYAWTYRWVSPRIDAQDLAQTLLLHLIERLPRALEQEEPCAYLVVVLRNEIKDACFAQACLIRTPEVHSPHLPTFPHYEVVSLNAPLVEQHTHACTLAEVLPEPQMEPVKEEEAYHPLYQAVEALPARQRETIQRHYGLDCAPESLTAISRSMMGPHAKARSVAATLYKKQALTKLQKRLEGCYAS